MPYAIEIRFDQETENCLSALWQRAATFYGSDYLLRNQVIPHVALLVGDAKLETIFHELEIPSGPIALSGLGFFNEGKIAYIRVKSVEKISAFHSSAYRAARKLGAEIDSHYTPENWLPHCTIAQQCLTNLNQSMESFVIEARMKSLILVSFPPTALLAERAST